MLYIYIYIYICVDHEAVVREGERDDGVEEADDAHHVGAEMAVRLSLYLSIYMYMYVCIYIYIYILW